MSGSQLKRPRTENRPSDRAAFLFKRRGRMSEVLFTSSRPLERAENLKAVWDAFDGGKRFARIAPNGRCAEAENAELDGRKVVVTDEFLKTIHGKDACKVVHVGHGITGGKTYGLDQKVRYYTPEQTAQVDYFIVTGAAGIPIAASQAGIPQHRVLPLGMPRTDAYFGKEKGDGGTCMAKTRRAYLYAPSFRAGWEPNAPAIDWASVDSLLEPYETVYVKRHMMSGSPISGGELERVVEISPDEPSVPYVIDCDVLGTDYSTILADGFLMGKPGVLFCPDWREYVSTRGMCLNYPDDYCSIAVSDEKSLVEGFRCAFLSGMGPVERRCMELMAGACDGHSTERVVDLVRSLL